jgi:hypothetical protein
LYASSSTGGGQHSIYQRVPALQDEGRAFKVWSAAVNDILTPGRDIAWVFGGKVPSHEKILKEQMNKLKWDFKTIHLQYDPRAMKDAGYFKRMRGVGNAGATELLFIAWKVMRALSSCSLRCGTLAAQGIHDSVFGWAVLRDEYEGTGWVPGPRRHPA